LPLLFHFLLQIKAVLGVLMQSINLAQLLDLDVGLQHQGFSETRASKADVTYPGLSFKLDQIDVMGAPAGLRTIAVNPRHVGVALETQLSESHKEQTILLETIAAAVTQQYFSSERFAVELDALVTKHIDVFVGNVLQVQEMQIPQCLQIYLRRSGVSDSLEIQIQKIIRH
jgi:uncharacterized coiled-coil protein SlyX